MNSLLEDFKSKMKPEGNAELDQYNKDIRTCPPVSASLLAYLDMMFFPKDISPTSISMSQELIIQHGIDKVITHLRRQNERQEEDIRQDRTKES